MVDKETGTVRWFNETKGCGFVYRDDGDEIFVHRSGIEGSGFRALVEGQRVEFRVAEDFTGPAALGRWEASAMSSRARFRRELRRW